MKNTIHALLAVFSATLVPAVADAGHDSPLVAAACEYRDAVKDFERTVVKVRFIDRYDIRLVNRLEDAACDLHSASRHPERIDRLEYRWQEVQSLHRRVGAAIFGRSCYPQHPALIRCWERVSCAYRELAQQVQCVCNAHQAYRPSLGGSSGTSFRPPVIAPQPGGPAFPSPWLSSPSSRLPHGLVPDRPQIDRRVRPQIAPPAPPADVRHFGPRSFQQRSGSRANFDVHFSGNDLRAAMIGAVLQRLAQ